MKHFSMPRGHEPFAARFEDHRQRASSAPAPAPAPPVAHVSAFIADAFGMRGLPNVVVQPPERS